MNKKKFGFGIIASIVAVTTLVLTTKGQSIGNSSQNKLSATSSSTSALSATLNDLKFLSDYKAPIAKAANYTCPSSTQLASWENDIFNRVNQYRASQGKSNLQRNGALDSISRSYAQQNLNSGVMSDANGGSYIRQAGFGNYSWGVNADWGRSSAQEDVTAWIGSPVHKDNMLGNFSSTGVGVLCDPNSRITYFSSQIYIASFQFFSGATAPSQATTPTQPYYNYNNTTTGTNTTTPAQPAANQIGGNQTTNASIPGITNNYAAQVLYGTNVERQKNGLRPLSWNANLAKAANDYAALMRDRNFFSHTGPDGSRPNNRITAAGYTGFTWWGENIAAGQPNPDAVMQAWMNSEGHRKNILEANFTELGVGYVTGGSYGHYWAQEFGQRPGTATTYVGPPASTPTGNTGTNTTGNGTVPTLPGNTGTTNPPPAVTYTNPTKNAGNTIPQTSDKAKNVYELLNAFRSQQNPALEKLSWNLNLAQAAYDYAGKMANGKFFAHESPDGTTPLSRITKAGYSNPVVWGENIAAGQPDAQTVMTAWINSEGHRANLAFKGFKEVGIGYVSVPGSPYRDYWVQEFGARANSPATPVGYAPVNNTPQNNTTTVPPANTTPAVSNPYYQNPTTPNTTTPPNTGILPPRINISGNKPIDTTGLTPDQIRCARYGIFCTGVSPVTPTSTGINTTENTTNSPTTPTTDTGINTTESTTPPATGVTSSPKLDDCLYWGFNCPAKDTSKNSTIMVSILSQLNAFRTQQGLPVVAKNITLDKSAQAQADEMAKKISFDVKNPVKDKTPETYIKDAGYIATKSGAAFHQDWTLNDSIGGFESQDYLPILLDKDLKDLGVGIGYNDTHVTFYKDGKAQPGTYWYVLHLAAGTSPTASPSPSPSSSPSPVASTPPSNTGTGINTVENLTPNTGTGINTIENVANPSDPFALGSTLDDCLLRNIGCNTVPSNAATVPTITSTYVTALPPAAEARKLFDLVNQLRVSKGKKAVTANATLVSVSTSYAKSMATNKFFDHKGPDGSTPESRVKAAGYNPTIVNENLAGGYANATQTLAGWVNNKDLFDNLMNDQLQDGGTGYWYEPSAPYLHYWVGLFAVPSAANSAGTIDTVENVTNQNGQPATTVSNKTRPISLTITEPNGTSDSVTSGSDVTIKYSLKDEQGDSKVSFLYDVDNTGYDGIMINNCINLPEGDDLTCKWSTKDVAPRNYFIYAVVSNDLPTMKNYSAGPVTVKPAATTSNDTTQNEPQTQNTFIANFCKRVNYAYNFCKNYKPAE